MGLLHVWGLLGTWSHWVRSNDLPRGDRSVYEMEVITRVMEALVMIDQVNVPNLVDDELRTRRWQVIRQAHRSSRGAQDNASADIVMARNLASPPSAAPRRLQSISFLTSFVNVSSLLSFPKKVVSPPNTSHRRKAQPAHRKIGCDSQALG